MSVLILYHAVLIKIALNYLLKLNAMMLPGSQDSGILFVCFSDSAGVEPRTSCMLSMCGSKLTRNCFVSL